jgi:hypothetical protein
MKNSRTGFSSAENGVAALRDGQGDHHLVVVINSTSGSTIILSLSLIAPAVAPSGTLTELSGVSPLGIWILTAMLFVASFALLCSSKVRNPPWGTVWRRVPCRMSVFVADSMSLNTITPAIYIFLVAIQVSNALPVPNTAFKAAKSLISE